MKPLIGITTGEIVNPRKSWSPLTYGQTFTYSDAIIRAGGLPVLIPITQDLESLKQIFGRLAGILFAGGNDLNPDLYGEHITKTRDHSNKRDYAETNLMRWALDDAKPILCICRGMQLLNVVHGGSLHQDIATDLPGSANHEASSNKQDGQHLAHNLRLAKDSKLAKILNVTAIRANAHHHQGIKQLAANLRASAWAEDDMIEGIEVANGNQFVIGVQCHPESLQDAEPAWNNLFTHFIFAATL